MAATKKRQKQLEKDRLARLRKAKKAVDTAPLIIMPPDVTKGLPNVDFSAMFRAISERSPRVWDAIIQYLGYFEYNHYKQFGTPAIKSLNGFVQSVYAAMAFEGFGPSPQQAVKMIQMGHVFHHLVASSCYQDNDAILDTTLAMEGNVPKILFLMNPRCKIQLPQAKLYDNDQFLTSLWYQSYMCGISSPTGLIQQNLYRHLANMDERWLPPSHSVSGLYFSCTYHNPQSVRRVKSIINKSIKKGDLPKFINIPAKEGKKHIGIVTNKWHRNHAVYKSASPLVEQLIGEYRLTLIWTGPRDNMPKTIVSDYFDQVVHCHFLPDGNLIFPQELRENDFDMLYYPDIGMTDESIWMSNLRIAPIQAVGYGHPDTTGDGNEIDYFIGGDVEKDSTDQYAETMVLLPGLAQEPAWPSAPRQHNYQDDGIVRINCVWGPDKYNYRLMATLAEINKQVEQHHKDAHEEAAACGAFVDSRAPNHEFHLFASPGVNRYAALPSFVKEVSKLLPNAILHSEQEYFAYMENAEMHDFSLNSFPFGCYNVLIESLYMGLPFLTLVGDRFYNRAGMWLNDQIGMDENNFTEPKDFVTKAVILITEPDHLRRQREYLASLDLKERLFTLQDKHFLKAVQHIFTNHPFTETKIIGDEK